MSRPTRSRVATPIVSAKTNSPSSPKRSQSSATAASRETSSARVAGGKISGSFWSPSRGPTSQIVTRLEAAGVDLLRPDPDDDALFALVPGVLVLAEVLLRQLVDVLPRPLGGQL